MISLTEARGPSQDILTTSEPTWFLLVLGENTAHLSNSGELKKAKDFVGCLRKSEDRDGRQEDGDGGGRIET